MPPDAPAADSEFLTIDQAVANLDAAEKREDEAPPKPDAASQQEPNTEAEPAAEDASGPETATDDEPAETEDGQEEAEEAELPSIEPPRFWDTKAKERFRELPRDLQELVLSKETERDKATSSAMQKHAEARKAAEGEASRITQLTGVLDKLIPQAEETFKGRWQNVDWNAVVDQYGAGEALKLRNQMESEQTQIQQLHAAKDQADAATTTRYVATRFEQLKTVCPDLADDKAGPERQLQLVQFLSENGVDKDTVIKRASASELSLAYDAMRWRQAQASAKAQASAPKTPAQNKPAVPGKPSVKPTAAPTRSGSPQSARIQTLQRKLSLTTDELVELMDLQGT